jgi:hypothetical protein
VRGRGFRSFARFWIDSAVAAPPSDEELRLTQFFIEVALSTPTPVAEPVDDPEGGGEVGPGTNPAADDSICGAAVPVTWCEIEFPDATTRRYAKVPINIGDPKEPRATTFGTVHRALSNAFGDSLGSQMSPTLTDVDGALRAAEDDDSLVGSRYSQYVSSKALLKADPTKKTRVFDGVITDCEPEAQRTFSLQVTDYLTVLLDEFSKRTFPQRVFNLEDFPNMANRSDDPTSPGNPTMVGKPVPILYGALSDEHADTPVGVVPWVFTGRVPFASRGGQMWDEYIAAGHDIGGWQSHFVASGGGLSTGTSYPSRVQINAGSGLVEVAWPGTTLWSDEFGTARTITRNGNTYLAMYMFGPRSDLSRSGQVPHVSNLWGIDENGDGTGRVIDDLYRQILHLLINWVFGDYRGGAWLSPRTVGAGLELYSRMDTTTFEAIKDRRETQLGMPVKGAFILGHAGTTVTLTDLLTLAAKNGKFDYGTNRHGQIIASIIDETLPINRDLTALANVIERTYKAKRRRDLVRNIVSYRYARRYVPPLAGGTPAEGELLPATTVEQNPEWAGAVIGDDAPRDAVSVSKHGERPETIDFEMVRDADTAAALVDLTLEESASAVVGVGFEEGECGVDTDLGMVDALTHFDALSDSKRSMRCEVHDLDLDQFTVRKQYREFGEV